MLTKIGEVSARYELSGRTLRYWEEAGILSSTRMENGYRYYDMENLQKIERIMALRRLRVPLADIQQIFLSNELSLFVEVLTRHLNETKQEAEALKSLGTILEHLIAGAKAKQQLADVFENLQLPEETMSRQLKQALKLTFSERMDQMSQQSSAKNTLPEVRIVQLPKMAMACCQAESKTPEDDCAAIMDQFVRSRDLLNHYGFRHFGFNNPDPQENNPVYGYEMWVAVPPDMEVPAPLWKKTFGGGLFAAASTTMDVIGERWRLLMNWVNDSGQYEVDWDLAADRRWLEECIDYERFNDPSLPFEQKQLDLLLPIKIKRSPSA